MKHMFLLFWICVTAVNASAQDTTYKSVTEQLFVIDELDQRYRNQIDEVENKYGRNSEELKSLYKTMNQADSANLVGVESIIDRYGWLGYHEIGSQANTTLFMVIQHADLPTWKKYLPVMQNAVAHGKAKASHLALLQDRLNLYEGKEQVYGSQLLWSTTHNAYFVLPLIDPDEVDSRRKSVGLPPLADYLQVWELKWDVVQYKKDLPWIVAEWKSLSHE